MHEIELWEAVALTVNLEPDELPVYLGADALGDNPFRICPSEFQKRLRIANSNAGTAFSVNPVHHLRARCLVDLPTFGAWATRVWDDLPYEFPIAAPVGKPEPRTVPEVTPETTDQRCARLLRWFEEEKGRGQRGALARVVKRDGRARQTVKADLERAQKQRQEASNPIAMMARKITR